MLMLMLMLMNSLPFFSCHDVAAPPAGASAAAPGTAPVAKDTNVDKKDWTSSGFLRENEAFVSGGRSGSNFSFTRMPMPPQALYCVLCAIFTSEINVIGTDQENETPRR